MTDGCESATALTGFSMPEPVHLFAHRGSPKPRSLPSDGLYGNRYPRHDNLALRAA